MSCIAQIRHTAPTLWLFAPNTQTMHSRSFSLDAVLAPSSCVDYSSCSDYSPAVTSAPFLRFFVPNNSMVQRSSIPLFHFIRRSFTPHSRQGDRFLYITGSSSACSISLYFGGGLPFNKFFSQPNSRSDHSLDNLHGDECI